MNSYRLLSFRIYGADKLCLFMGRPFPSLTYKHKKNKGREDQDAQSNFGDQSANIETLSKIYLSHDGSKFINLITYIMFTLKF